MNNAAQQLRHEASLIEQKADWREALLNEEKAAFADDEREEPIDMRHRWECLEDVIFDLRSDAHHWRGYADHLEENAIAAILDRLSDGYVVIGGPEDDDPRGSVRLADSDDRGLYDGAKLLALLESLSAFDEGFWDAVSEAEVRL